MRRALRDTLGGLLIRLAEGARNVQISTSNFGLDMVDLDSEDSNPHARKIAYIPAVSESYNLWYKYHWMGVTRSVETENWYTRETLTMR